MTDIAIRRIEPLSAFKFGVLLGHLIMLVPGLLLGLFVRLLVGILRRWLEGWESLGVGPLAVNILDMVKLSGFLQTLQNWDDQGWLLVLILTFATMIAGGLLTGLIAIMGARGYNLLAAISGGLVIKADILNSPSPPVPPAGRVQGSPQALPQPEKTSAWLMSHDNPEERLPLRAGTMSFGSASGNAVVLDGLAPRHAELRLENNRYILYELGRGETWVNERPITGANMLKDGFRVRLGPYHLVFRQV